MTDGHTETLIATKVRRLEELELQQSYHGTQTPPHIAMEIKDLRTEIATLRYQRTQLVFQKRDLDVTPPPAARGLILLISPLQQGNPLATHSAYQSIEYHRTRLEHCWLIATDDSHATAEALARHFGVYQLPCSIHTVANGADAIETQVLVTSIVTQIHQDGVLNPAEVIADITGCTKAMAAGLVLACGTTWRMQYMLFQDKGLPSLPVLLHTHANEEAS